MGTIQQLKDLHARLDACSACSGMIGPVVHGPAIRTPVMLIGQAPGVHEGKFMRPFAWTAGKTMFRWFEAALGVDEETFRNKVYMSAVARCFPGKAPKGGGDRKPSPAEIEACRPFLEREVRILKPQLIIPVGTMAIEQVTGEKRPLAEVVGKKLRARYHGVETDVICLPHPSGASVWHMVEPGKTLLKKALKLIARHPAVVAHLGHSPRLD